MHMIDLSNDRANMAYIGKTPWHGLGQQLTEGLPLEEWAREAGLDWQILDTRVRYVAQTPYGEIQQHVAEDRKVLYRSDTQALLNVVSDRYQPVQPREVLEFFRDLIADQGFQIDTAGSLAGGQKIWALARTGQSTRVRGQDLVNGYLLLATACDSTLATTAMFTTVRVVCNNTLTLATDHDKASQGRVKVRHSTKFDADAVKTQLGLAAGAWSRFEEQSGALADRKVSDKETVQFIVNVLGDPKLDVNDEGQPNQRGMKRVLQLYKGEGQGSTLASADGTAWGLVRAVTEFNDFHRRAMDQDRRLNSAWFGNGAREKQKAWDEGLRLVA